MSTTPEHVTTLSFEIDCPICDSAITLCVPEGKHPTKCEKCPWEGDVEIYLNNK